MRHRRRGCGDPHEDNRQLVRLSPSLTYPLIGAILGIGAPAGAFVLRLVLDEHARSSPLGELQTHAFFYAYQFVGSCIAFCVAGWIAGVRAEQLRKAESFYHELADHDPLTGLFNARAFRERYARARDHAVKSGGAMSLLLIDVDHLKTINDQHGHAVGNEALLHVARVLRAAKRDNDSAARWGGDEYAILLDGGDANAAARVAQNVVEQLRNSPMPLARGNLRVTVTIGSISASGAAANEDLFVAADRALYEGKSQGRDRAVAGEATSTLRRS